MTLQVCGLEELRRKGGGGEGGIPRVTTNFGRCFKCYRLFPRLSGTLEDERTAIAEYKIVGGRV